MYATSLFTILLALQPPPSDLPTETTFAPVRAEITTDEQGIEILAYDEHDDLVGALVAAPTDDHIRIDADFDDGYASVAFALGPDEPVENLQSNLDPHVAAARLSKMFAFVTLPETVPLDASKQQCMWIFAGVAGTCGLAALYPANIFSAWGCISGFGYSLCQCGQYLPIEIDIC